jgi:hypothetical protein
MSVVPLGLLTLLVPIALSPAAAQDARKEVAAIVRKIQRADYEGDRKALRQQFEALTPYADDEAVGSRVRYWRGFALWRRALNGFNEAVDSPENGQDLAAAVTEFERAYQADPAFVDAKVGAISCLQNLAFVHRSDPARIQELVDRFVPLIKEAFAAAPQNPRLLWVRGASQWYNPPERGGGQEVALATYARGLESARKLKGSVTDPLEPSWGEPELLMNLAFANLNAKKPDIAAAEKYAQAALALVPYWHYVRDILMPQIQKAKSGKNAD